MPLYKCSRCLRDEFTLHAKLGEVILIYPLESTFTSNVEKMKVCTPHIREVSDYLNNHGFNYGKSKFKKSIELPQQRIEKFLPEIEIIWEILYLKRNLKESYT